MLVYLRHEQRCTAFINERFFQVGSKQIIDSELVCGGLHVFTGRVVWVGEGQQCRGAPQANLRGRLMLLI